MNWMDFWNWKKCIRNRCYYRQKKKERNIMLTVVWCDRCCGDCGRTTRMCECVRVNVACARQSEKKNIVFRIIFMGFRSTSASTHDCINFVFHSGRRLKLYLRTAGWALPLGLLSTLLSNVFSLFVMHLCVDGRSKQHIHTHHSLHSKFLIYKSLTLQTENAFNSLRKCLYSHTHSNTVTDDKW